MVGGKRNIMKRWIIVKVNSLHDKNYYNVHDRNTIDEHNIAREG